MRQVATAFVGADGKRIYAEVAEQEYDRILAQLQSDDHEGFAKMEFAADENSDHVDMGLLVPAREFMDAWEKARAGEPAG